MTKNVNSLMKQLPIHSHHRAPLIHFLSKDLNSATAANILHTSPSYIRQCKRKDYDDADLFQDRYARDIKRQKSHPGVLTELIEYITAACPVKSGSRSQTHYQYITDDSLYQGYLMTVSTPMSFNTFMKIKSWLKVKHTGKYFGMFDCYYCFRLKQLPSLIQSASCYSTRLKCELELSECQLHQELHFINAISTL